VWPCGKPSVLLADDHADHRRRLRRLLEPECDSRRHRKRRLRTLETARETRPDIVLVDITMPLLNGIDATVQLLRDLGNSRDFLDDACGRAYATEASRRVPRDCGQARRARRNSAGHQHGFAGGAYMSSQSRGTGAMTETPACDRTPGVASFHLTTRQRQVLQLVAEGIRRSRSVCA